MVFDSNMGDNTAIYEQEDFLSKMLETKIVLTFVRKIFNRV